MRRRPVRFQPLTAHGSLLRLLRRIKASNHLGPGVREERLQRILRQLLGEPPYRAIAHEGNEFAFAQAYMPLLGQPQT